MEKGRHIEIFYLICKTQKTAILLFVAYLTKLSVV
jgi:hypothetical protein